MPQLSSISKSCGWISSGVVMRGLAMQKRMPLAGDLRSASPVMKNQSKLPLERSSRKGSVMVALCDLAAR